ncbi:small RNA degrading nuclease 1-like [Lycium ferocissimum]|uniref:small RNA degrading nuclease 1-like n=1 Tax=Lycium ferocissimum TaxID=112874 RepID=UPI002814F10F|nr:small RNA degrading nuclease 1-like [Lycium ferocissimum]
MESKLESAKKEVLAEIVKLAQKREMKGSSGGWKDFLRSHDKKFGVSLSDPSKRSVDVLLAFLKTFSQDDLKYFDKVFECHSNRDAVEQLQKSSPESETVEQRLVRLTFEHPQYPTDYSFPSHEEDWLVTKRSKKSNFTQSKAMVAIDCEMVLCEDGTEALVRICAVDRNLEVKLNEFVNPNKPIADYRTEITGITAGDLDGVSCTLADVQTSMKKLLSHGTILIGHSLHNDLHALKIDHARVIDTSYVFKYQGQASNRRPSLSNLCKSVLGFELRKMGSPHNCLDDACTAMKLVLAKIERGVDIIPVVSEEVQEPDTAKLLVHRIPEAVHSQELHKVIPGDFNVEVKANKKGQADKYTAFANFKSQHEANEAFDKLEGNQEKDTGGRPQKLVSFRLDSGISGSLYVRKMAANNYSKEVTPKKRPFEDEEAMGESKKLRTEDQSIELKEAAGADCNQCETHLKEIERLKKELSHRDEEISNLNKLIVNLVRKQGF